MLLYLVQHGTSKSQAEDPERGLSPEGMWEVRRLAGWLGGRGLQLTAIRHSGKRRAQQTATLLAKEIRADQGVQVGKHLSPLDDPKLAAATVQDETGDLMLVGHLPHLERLAALLLTGQAENRPIRFRNAGVVCLERDENQIWSLRWALSPDLLPERE